MNILKAKTTIQNPLKVTPNPKATQAEPVKVKRHVELELGDIETGFEFPTLHRGSMYDFKLDEMAEKSRRFIALPEGLSMETLKAALNQHIVIERTNRNNLQNFRTLPAEIDGVQGYYVYCMSIQDMPMRKSNKNKDKDEAKAA